jgi:hypothetical protein
LYVKKTLNDNKFGCYLFSSDGKRIPVKHLTARRAEEEKDMKKAISSPARKGVYRVEGFTNENDIMWTGRDTYLMAIRN